jgi:hypothetical protein
MVGSKLFHKLIINDQLFSLPYNHDKIEDLLLNKFLCVFFQESLQQFFANCLQISITNTIFYN